MGIHGPSTIFQIKMRVFEMFAPGGIQPDLSSSSTKSMTTTISRVLIMFYTSRSAHQFAADIPRHGALPRCMVSAPCQEHTRSVSVALQAQNVGYPRPTREIARRSVSRVLSRPKAGMAIHLGRSSPSASRDRPERRREGPPGGAGNADTACRSYLVLLPVGFSLPPPLPAARCALTAPFHPYRPPPRRDATERAWRYVFCGTFPGVAPAGRYPAPYLRGARTFLPPPRPQSPSEARPSDRLAWENVGRRAPRSKRRAESDSAIRRIWRPAEHRWR